MPLESDTLIIFQIISSVQLNHTENDNENYESTVQILKMIGKNINSLISTIPSHSLQKERLSQASLLSSLLSTGASAFFVITTLSSISLTPTETLISSSTTSMFPAQRIWNIIHTLLSITCFCYPGLCLLICFASILSADFQQRSGQPWMTSQYFFKKNIPFKDSFKKRPLSDRHGKRRGHEDIVHGNFLEL